MTDPVELAELRATITRLREENERHVSDLTYWTAKEDGQRQRAEQAQSQVAVLAADVTELLNSNERWGLTIRRKRASENARAHLANLPSHATALVEEHARYKAVVEAAENWACSDVHDREATSRLLDALDELRAHKEQRDGA